MKRRQFLAGAGALLALPAAVSAAPAGPGRSALPGTVPEHADFLGPIYRLPVDDVQLAFRDFGDGPPLLLLGERSTTMSWWQVDLLRGLSTKYRVITLDSRGVGFSTDNPAAELSIARMASDASGLLFGLGISRARILGWGMGGNVGLRMALEDSRRVLRLLVSGADPGGSAATAPIPEVAALLSDAGSEPEQLMAVMFNPAARAAKAAFLASLSRMPGEEISPATVRRQTLAMEAWRRDDATAGKLGAISVPVMVHYGTRDAVTPPANGELLAERIPGVRREPVEGGGHACMFEQLESFLAIAHDFLR